MNKSESNLSNVLGNIVMLLSTSPQYEHFFLSDLKWLILPAIRTMQFRIWDHENLPVGLAIWANVSESIDKQLMKGEYKLSPNDWDSGTQPWLYVWITPEVDTVTDIFLYDLSQTQLAGKTVKYHKINPQTKTLEVVTYDVPTPSKNKKKSTV